MGFRFRRRVSIIPGVWLNLSKSGISTSVGGRGLTYNLSKRGTRKTVGLPGTGLSWRSPTKPWQDVEGIEASAKNLEAPEAAPESDIRPSQGWKIVFWGFVIGVVVGVILLLAS